MSERVSSGGHERPDQCLERSVKAHAEALGLPVERFYEVETDLSP